MDNLIPKLYKNYGDYCNWRTLPSEIDGLKPIERRVLLSVYQIARNKFVKSVRIDGHCLGHYHPHSSSYGTLVQMVYQGFVIGQGNWGLQYDDLKPAAARYTEAKLNPHMEKLAFELLNYVPWKSLDLDKEPLYLPTMYPLCLLGKTYSTGIGFGYKTLIPIYSEIDLHKRLLYLIGVRKRKPTIKPISDCEILSDNNDIERLLIEGKSKIKVRGIFDINNEDYSVSLKSWPYGVKSETLIGKFKNELDQGDIGYNDFSDSEKNIVFKVIKQRNRSIILEKFVKKLTDEITSDISFDIIAIDKDGKVKRTSVDKLILNSYNNYKNLSISMLKDQKEKQENILREYSMLEKVKPLLSKYLKTHKDCEEIIELISQELKTDENIIKLLFSKYRINKLLTLKIDKDEILYKINEIKNKLENVGDYVLGKYTE